MPRWGDVVVSTADLLDGSVTTPKLAADAVTTAKMADDAVTTAKLAALAVDAAALAADAVTTTKIANSAVTTTKIDDLAVTTAKIGLLAVGSAQIGNLAVTSGKIANLAVGTAQIANAAITNAKINDLSADKINAGIITALRYRTASSGARLEIRGDTAAQYIQMFDSLGNQIGAMGLNTGDPGIGSSDLAMVNTSGDIYIDTSQGAGGIFLVGASGQVVITGSGQLIVDGPASAATPAVVFDNNQDTGFYHRLSARVGIASDGSTAFETDSSGSYTTDGSLAICGWAFLNDNNTGLIRSNADQMDLVTGAVARLRVLGSTGSNVWIDRRLTDVGNVEVLRVNRSTSSGLQPIGYFSSLRSHKRVITPLPRSRTWRTEWIDQLRPVTYRRRSTGWREIGFVIEDLAAVGGGQGRYLTTHGDDVGGSPDEFALLAVTVDAVQDLRRRVAALEQAPAA